MIDLTRASPKQLEATLQQGVTLVDFAAPWCRPCRAQEPIIHELEQDYEGSATIASVNIDENQEVALSLGIQSIPTMILYREGREVERFIGLQNRETLSKAIGEAIQFGRPQPNRVSRATDDPLDGS